MKLNEIYNYIDTFAPFSTQDGFDNSGLLVESGETEITKAAICLDITNEVIEEAHSCGAQLIISHHPVIFHKLAALSAAALFFPKNANESSISHFLPVKRTSMTV
mgnify:CR=1 FL=1